MARYEPFGLAVLEAAQAGLRAGAVRHPDLPGAVGRRRDLFVPPTDEAAWAAAIR